MAYGSMQVFNLPEEMPVITASIELIKKEALGGPVIYPCYLKMQSQQGNLYRDARHEIEV